MGDQITITLPDGAKRALRAGSTGADVAAAIGRRLAKAAVIVTVDGAERDLGDALPDGAELAVVTADSERGRYTIRHSTAHVLAQAVLDLFPGATFGIGPPIEDGFYYDFELPGGATFTPEDLERIEARMREIIGEAQPFVRNEISSDEARKVFCDHKYKLEIISGAAEDPTSVTEAGVVRTYENPPRFIDLCRGPHVRDTSHHLGHFALTRVAGAYWRGDEHNPMLQRIYGTAWESKQALEEHLRRLEEAEARDHRKLARELELVAFPPELGPGLAIFLPKGAIVRKEMEDWIRGETLRRGYQPVYSPHIAKEDLWRTSGHLENYADLMYPGMDVEAAAYRLKPMNCPFHIMAFASRTRSYRELPLRISELGTVYRFERSGVVSGMLRARGFTQDDSHIFCTPAQVTAEVSGCIDFARDVFAAFGLGSPSRVAVSTRPEGKSIGTEEQWARAEEALQEAAASSGLEYGIDDGEGAFYGPKIDVHARDAIGREWQLSTIQVDFNLPERFDITYVGEDGAPHQPFMIHRALFGSVERFFAVLLESTAGAFPTWLAPVQARVLGVRDDHDAYAADVAARLRTEGLRADWIEADEPLGARIRRAKLEKLPHVLVVGDDDVLAGTVADDARGADRPERDIPLDAFVARLRAEVDERR